MEFARKDEEWIKRKFTKPIFEIWQELNGKLIFPLDIIGRTSYSSVQKVRTFTPPSSDPDFVFSQLSKNIENACIKIRRYNLAARKATFFLKLQNFQYRAIEVKFSRPTAIPSEIITLAQENFDQMFEENVLYRATGVTLFNLEEDKIKQLNLFNEVLKAGDMRKLYQHIDELAEKFGKHTIFLGTSFMAHDQPQYQKERGDQVARKEILFKRENKRQRIGIPMFVGDVT